MTIDIFIPLYNASEYVMSLQKSLEKQKNVRIKKINYILTESTDNTEEILKKNKLTFQKIKKEEFSHSLTREKSAMKSTADIIVFISQDVIIEDSYWLHHLVKNIINHKAEAAYSRQISKYNNLEKYTREKNYPSTSKIVTKEDISDLGLKTFFFSDAASAILLSVFKKLEGFDQKKLPINEDMYFAYKLIMNGYKISYEADSIVYHSHDFTLKEIYCRYKLTGKFMKDNSYLDQYGTTKAGGGLALYILKRALVERNIKVLFRYPFDMGARFFGMKRGKK